MNRYKKEGYINLHRVAKAANARRSKDSPLARKAFLRVTALERAADFRRSALLMSSPTMRKYTIEGAKNVLRVLKWEHIANKDGFEW